MNISKVSNSADFVNYVKPEVLLIEMEIEGSLLLTASGGGTGSGPVPDMSAGGDDKGSTIGGGGTNTGSDFSVRKPRVRR
jgi:hypothetical protein